MTRIRQAGPEDWSQLAALRALLWPDASEQEHLAELQAGQSSPGQPQFPSVALVSEDEHGSLTGFLEVGLRSHADGCDTQQPVGFIEGWFVREEHRGKGVGRELITRPRSGPAPAAAVKWPRMR